MASKIMEFSDYKASKVCIWGAFPKGRELRIDLRLEVRVDCFSDNDEQKHGTLVDGVPCISLEELTKQKEETLVIIAASKKHGIKEQLQKEGFPYVVYQEDIMGSFSETILRYFVLNILDHCNMNCQGCNHFANIAEKRFVSIEDIRRDTKRMSELCEGGKVARIGVMGGEPLLHPDLLEILEVTRMHFPKSLIQLVSNGLLLLQQKEEFWICCKEYDIEIVVTKYPINQNYQGMVATALKYGVKFRFYGDSDKVIKTSYKNPLDVEGVQDCEKSFQLCFLSKHCHMLMEGYFYPCTLMPNIGHFNKKFGYDMQITKEDRLNIYETSNAEEIIEFVSTPKPFCRFCIPEKMESGIPWARTKKVKEEWLVD